MHPHKMIGAKKVESGVQFCLWSPQAERVEVLVDKMPYAMAKDEFGYFDCIVSGLTENVRYKFRVDGKKEFPDPASRYQPEGPHGDSQVVEEYFPWTDQEWQGLSLDELVLYELHVGTFTPEGTFAGVEKRIPHLKSLGINAIEIMPVAQFAGKRNWGYDGVGIFAPQNTYGGDDISPIALKKLVNTCHAHGIAVFLDVVYNHLGPEGNYLPELGPYFQNKYKTPWGEALNFDGEWSDGVRNYFFQNARQWLEEFHFDGLRLDAVHAIFDTSAVPFLEELVKLKADLQTKVGRKLHLIAESESNDSRLLRPHHEGGLGLDGQWADDLHHVVHTLITKENQGYYAEYGKVIQLKDIFTSGILFQGEYSSARRRRHGRSFAGISRTRLVVCSQNHDQIGNRGTGDRLIVVAGPEKQKLAATAVMLSGALPMIFMGEEFAETNPFQYFVDHTDVDLLESVRKGRREEFKSFQWDSEVPDPASEQAFLDSKLNWERVSVNPTSRHFLDYYKKLIELSKWIRREKIFENESVEVQTIGEGEGICVKGRGEYNSYVELYFNFSETPLPLQVDLQARNLEIVLDSSDTGQGPQEETSVVLQLRPYSAIVFRGQVT